MDVDCRMLIWESSFIWSVIAVSSNNLCLLLAFCRIYETDLQLGEAKREKYSENCLNWKQDEVSSIRLLFRTTLHRKKYVWETHQKTTNGSRVSRHFRLSARYRFQLFQSQEMEFREFQLVKDGHFLTQLKDIEKGTETSCISRPINQLYQYKIFMSFYKADHPQTNVCEMGYVFWGRVQIFWLSTTDEIQWFSKIDVQSKFWRSGNSILGLLQWWWWWWWWGSSSS